MILNEKNKIVHNLWDGVNLKCTFRRTISVEMMRAWEEIIQLATTITFSKDKDEMIWTFS